MLLLIDNYDSFTYNLYQYLAELGAERVVLRNDGITVAEAEALRPTHLVLSPGPCTPREAGICVDADPDAGAAHPDPGRLPGASVHRRGLRRRGDARAGAGARQGEPDQPSRRGRLSRAAIALRGDALPQPDRRARDPAA